MVYHWILVPVLTACIGWLAIRMAIWLLFRPLTPRNILGINIQGYLPRRQQQIARQLGKLVTDEFLSFGDIAGRISRPENVQRIMPQVDGHIEQFLRVRLPEQMPVISMFIGDKTIAELKTVFMTEMEGLFPVVMNGYMDNLQDQLDLETIVAEKLAGLPSARLEQILRGSMAGAFRFLEISGIVMGLVIGLIAVALAG